MRKHIWSFKSLGHSEPTNSTPIATMCRVVFTLICIGSVAVVLLTALGCFDQLVAPKKPALPDTVNWGDLDDDAADGGTEEQTTISVSNETLNELKGRLKAFKFIKPLKQIGFEYGFNGNFMQQVVSHWLNHYDWREWESKINSFSNFYTRIEGLRVHFLHVKPPKETKKILPLLIVHGWPGSVFEFYKLIPLLTTPDSDGVAFEVIAPSIPGYGWSEAPRKSGFAAGACARVFAKLMERLGFEKYYVQGGDWGSFIGHVMAREYPDRLLGFHSNMPVEQPRYPSVIVQTIFGAWLPSGVLFNRRDNDKIYPLYKKLWTQLRESAYLHLHQTRPDTIAHGLSDSPVGLAAYILEKFSVWTDLNNRFAPDGNLIGPNAAFTLDELLTNVMIYWTTGTITSSMRFYKEDLEAPSAYFSIPSEVPYGIASFSNEISQLPERFVRVTSPNLLRFADVDKGGHFAALELPDVMNSEIREFVRLAEEFKEEKRQAEAALANAWYIA